ncbi:MAG TPA: patatin-like phospholipase family protein [Actinomycetota bacterium]|nr:patatin-like phospholipase family protein [Actinomycetota bacterium]
MAWVDLAPEGNVVRILSIDGGGIRGIIPARFLVELEEITGQRIADLFDIVAGTSTGALIALGLVCPGPDGRPALTAEDVQKIYVLDSPDLFPAVKVRRVVQPGGWVRARPNIYQRIGAVVFPRRFGNARYRANGLEAIIRRNLGEARIADAVTDVVVPTYDWKAGRSMIFSSRAARDGEGPNPTMAAVARGTTAAPTYFPPLKTTLEDGREVILIDGGVAANNPVTCAYAEALLWEQRLARDLDVMVVSLGTGRPPEEIPTYEELWSRGWLRLGMGMLNVVFDGTSEISDEMIRTIILKQEPNSRYWRFNTELRGVSLRLDDSSDQNLAGLLRLAQTMIADQREALEDLAGLLVKQVPCLAPRPATGPRT